MVLAGTLFGSFYSLSTRSLFNAELISSSLGVGTLACAISNSFWTLLAARAVTGAGGAGILTLSSIITTGKFCSSFSIDVSHD